MKTTVLIRKCGRGWESTKALSKRLEANLKGRLRYWAAIRAGADKAPGKCTYGKWEVRRAQSGCDRAREQLFWVRVRAAREARTIAARHIDRRVK